MASLAARGIVPAPSFTRSFMQTRTQHFFDRLLWINGKHVLLLVMVMFVVGFYLDGERNYILNWMEAHWIGRWVDTLPPIFTLCAAVIIGARVKASSFLFVVLCAPYMLFGFGLVNYTLAGSNVQLIDGTLQRSISATAVVIGLVVLAIPIVSWVMAQIFEAVVAQADSLRRERDALALKLMEFEAQKELVKDAAAP